LKNNVIFIKFATDVLKFEFIVRLFEEDEFNAFGNIS